MRAVVLKRSRRGSPTTSRTRHALSRGCPSRRVWRRHARSCRAVSREHSECAQVASVASRRFARCSSTMPWAHTADASWNFWRRRARLPWPPRDDFGRPRGARSSCAPATSWKSSCLSARRLFRCCVTALRFATRLSRHVVREAPVEDDAAIGGCTEVHDTMPIARQRPAPGAPAKETARRLQVATYTT